MTQFFFSDSELPKPQQTQNLLSYPSCSFSSRPSAFHRVQPQSNSHAMDSYASYRHPDYSGYDPQNTKEPDSCNGQITSNTLSIANQAMCPSSSYLSSNPSVLYKEVPHSSLSTFKPTSSKQSSCSSYQSPAEYCYQKMYGCSIPTGYRSYHPTGIFSNNTSVFDRVVPELHQQPSCSYENQGCSNLQFQSPFERSNENAFAQQETSPSLYNNVYNFSYPSQSTYPTYGTDINYPKTYYDLDQRHPIIEASAVLYGDPYYQVHDQATASENQIEKTPDIGELNVATNSSSNPLLPYTPTDGVPVSISNNYDSSFDVYLPNFSFSSMEQTLSSNLPENCSEWDLINSMLTPLEGENCLSNVNNAAGNNNKDAIAINDINCGTTSALINLNEIMLSPSQKEVQHLWHSIELEADSDYNVKVRA